MKRYFVFGIEYFYPGGGWDDFKEAFDDLEETVDFGTNLNEDVFQIIDGETGKYICQLPTAAYEKRREYSKKKWGR